MSTTPSDLEGLRRRLDEIDDRLQDLLIDRAEIVSMVAASKRGGNLPAFQPAREAEIIRRLVERHHGAFPIATLVRMWREMLAATVGLQSPFAVAVFAPVDRPGFWDLSRDHYGSNTPILACNSVERVISAVIDGLASVGVLPMPQEREPDPWWRRLLSTDSSTPRVIARLPFGAPGNARTGGADALAIGYAEQHETGLDRTLLATECAVDVARARILRALSTPGLVCTSLTSHEHRGSAAKLIEVEGVVPISDPRLDGLRREFGAALHSIGGYAVPLHAAMLVARG
jgi:chorismate mutase